MGKLMYTYMYAHSHSLFLGPLTSFLDADPDLTKAPQFTAYSSNEASSKPRPQATPTSSVGSGSRRPKGARFTDAEMKVLRYTIFNSYYGIVAQLVEHPSSVQSHGFKSLLK